MIYPTNMANAIIKDVIGCSYSFEVNDDGSVNFDTLKPLENPVAPTPENLQGKIGDAIKSYLEENMTFVIQVTNPPIMKNGDAPIPDPILALLSVGCPLTGVLKCGGEFSCKTLLPADIADGVAKLLAGSYLQVDSLSALVPGALPEPPIIVLPDLTPKIIPPTVNHELPAPVINFNIPEVSIDPPGFRFRPIINFSKWSLGSFHVTPSLKLPIPIPMAFVLPSFSLSTSGSVSITPPIPEISLTLPTPTLPAPQISVSGLNIVFEIPDVDLGEGIVSLFISDAELQISDIIIKAEDLVLPDIDLSGTYSIDLVISFPSPRNTKNIPGKIQLPPLMFSITIPQIGPLTINIGDIGPVDINVGKFLFNLNPGMISIPFLKPFTIPATGLAYGKSFDDIHIMDKISIEPIVIPTVFGPITKEVGPIDLPEIDVSKYNISYNDKLGYTIHVKKEIGIIMEPIHLGTIPLSKYVDIKIDGFTKSVSIMEEPIEVKIDMPELKGLKLQFGIDLASIFPFKIPIPTGVCNAALNLKNYLQNVIMNGVSFDGVLGPVVASLYWQQICAVLWMCLVGVSPAAGTPASGLCGDQYILAPAPVPAPSVPPAPTTLMWINPVATLNPVISPGNAQITMAL
jgi:hypothetical protein